MKPSLSYSTNSDVVQCPDGIRLLSQAGLPKLRRIAKERLKFKGKGHEVRQGVTVMEKEVD